MDAIKDTPVDWGGRGDIENRRDVILRTLNVALRKRGAPQSFRMQDIAEHLGLVKGNLYYYFKSKQELLFHCRIKCQQQSLEALERVERDHGSASERLYELLKQHILILSEGPYSASLLLEMDRLSPARHKKYVSMRDQFEAGVRRIIQQGITAGEFQPQDVRMASFAILGSINWIPKWYKVEGPSSAEKIADYQASFFVNALKATQTPISK